MATKLPHKMLTYNRQGEIDFASLEFDPYEPEPLPEGMIQNPYLFDFIPILVAHYEGRRDVFLDSNTFICYDRRNLNVRVGPDFYIATGVDARAIRERALYLPWEAGKPPDLALEVASASTARHDVGRKRGIYAEVGVPEYWRYDPTGGELYGSPLVGERLVEGEYQPIELTTAPDGVLKGFSPALGLSLGWNDQRLYLYDPDTGEYLRNYPEIRADLAIAEGAREAAEGARELAEGAREAAEAARAAAEARVRWLEEELRRQRGGD